jgi:DNA-binding response OmpR family regulator
MRRILIIDDDVQVLGMLRELFEINGYEVLGAHNGKEGVKLFREKGADIVLTDLIMPEKEGIETIIELHSDYPHLKIIAMSGGGRSGPDGHLLAAEGLGATRTFEKPIDIEELLAVVEELLNE